MSKFSTLLKSPWSTEHYLNQPHFPLLQQAPNKDPTGHSWIEALRLFIYKKTEHPEGQRALS
ncbi:hypothetical protein NC653_001618 [Populus alba x Populus x berolinensis]|uniref:Uncharacterized protein n=1 Tax=Populus alba x Populus x berolinensis TaxID=444605 RepID=A0AAD6WI41_9ROSI|nr:hypothetical protein NC653_001618 [Populus alba x Populus x berolinensis]